MVTGSSSMGRGNGSGTLRSALGACLASLVVGGVLGGEVSLLLDRGAGGIEATATCGAGVHRVVWQATDHLDGPWRSFAVGVAFAGKAVVPVVADGPCGFVRALPRESPGFLERLGRLREHVLQDWPDASLLEAHLLVPGWTQGSPDGLAVRGVFSVGMGTVTAVEETPGAAVTAEFRALPWMGSQVLAWPITMELEVAASRLEAAGGDIEYRSLTLRQPVYPGMTEPYWIFGTSSGFVRVGTWTGTVKKD